MRKRMKWPERKSEVAREKVLSGMKKRVKKSETLFLIKE